VTVPPLGVDVGEILPQGEEQSIDQVTPLFVGSWVTVTTNCAVVPFATVAEDGMTITSRPGTVKLSVVKALPSTVEAATRVTATSPTGIVGGAVYVVAVPLAVVEAESEPQALTLQDKVQVTPALVGSPVTVAVNGWVVPTLTVAGVGDTETDMADTVMEVEADLEELAMDVAWIVTLRGPDGPELGAV
jgi:hypothetical protein